MDLTLKSKIWAGNIFHQFESIFQDVDDFMSKDTLRYVEGQVQSIGISAKKLYSDVVLDVLPCVECEKHESANNEKVETRDCVKSDPTDTATVSEKQLFENQGPIDSATWKMFLGKSMPEANNSIPDKEMFLGKSEEDCQISTLMKHEEGLVMMEEMEKAASIHGEEKKCFSDDTKCLSNTSNSDLLSKSESRTIKDVNFDMAEDLATCDISSKGKSFDDLNSVEKHEVVSGDISCEEEMGSSSLPCSISPQYSNILESTCECFVKKDENKVESNGSAYNVMSLSSDNPDCAVDDPPTVLTFESNDNATTPHDGLGFFGGLFEVGMSTPSVTGNTDEFVVGIGDLNMQTVELSPGGKTHGEANVISNGNLGLSAMDGRRNFRYYKKLIRDALTCRKRLSKEYRDLGILYGEVHFEDQGSQHSRQSTSDAEWELI